MVNIGDITIQDQAVRLPSNKVLFFDRDMTTATGTQAITGVGFSPSSVIFDWSASSATETGHGFNDGTTRCCRYYHGTDLTWAARTNSPIMVHETSSNYQEAVGGVTFDTDGFTISWTKVGSPTGTARINFMAFK